MKANRETFGPRLRLERERRGLTLKQIAHITKIKESQFAELERGDISKWPQGIFRRAHMCAYASAIGLPSEPILSEFLELFPSEEPLVDQADQPDLDRAAVSSEAVKTAVASRGGSKLARRMWILVFDVAAVCFLGSIGAALAGAGLWTCVAVAALGYFSLASACFGQSIGSQVRDRIQRAASGVSPSHVDSTPLREVRLVASQRDSSRAFGRDKSRERELQPEVQQRRASA
jgi:transcriptional regulator with XRE-family HTH domain